MKRKQPASKQTQRKMQLDEDESVDKSISDSEEILTESAKEIITPSAEEDSTTFSSLGLVDPLCEACASIGWKQPSEIQREVLPYALKGLLFY